jgi:hypothetical protein
MSRKNHTINLWRPNGSSSIPRTCGVWRLNVLNLLASGGFGRGDCMYFLKAYLSGRPGRSWPLTQSCSAERNMMLFDDGETPNHQVNTALEVLAVIGLL